MVINDSWQDSLGGLPFYDFQGYFLNQSCKIFIYHKILCSKDSASLDQLELKFLLICFTISLYI